VQVVLIDMADNGCIFAVHTMASEDARDWLENNGFRKAVNDPRPRSIQGNWRNPDLAVGRSIEIRRPTTAPKNWSPNGAKD
jgi:hypothetical protein